MSEGTKIEWTGRTWNPVTGCDKISRGCKFCYAEQMAKRLNAMGQKKYANGFKVTLHPKLLKEPLRWKKPKLVFVNSMSDLFHEDVPWEFIIKTFFTMYEAKKHTFQILTKRHERLMQFREVTKQILRRSGLSEWEDGFMPAKNIWIGVSVEDQENADKRREAVKQISDWGWNTFVSYEPALRFVDWTGWEFVRWMIMGGESGPHARPMEAEWPENTMLWTGANKIPFFFKQWGGKNKKLSGCLISGKEFKEYPEGMR